MYILLWWPLVSKFNSATDIKIDFALWTSWPLSLMFHKFCEGWMPQWPLRKMRYEFFIHNEKVGWWLLKQNNFNMKFYSKCGWCLLSFYDPNCEIATSGMVYKFDITLFHDFSNGLSWWPNFFEWYLNVKASCCLKCNYNIKFHT
jgi:hypothetical protein